MFRILAHLAMNAVTVLIIHEILPDEVHYESTQTLLIFALILGGFNAIVRPIIELIALPLTCLTLGLFSFVISAAIFWVSAQVSPGVEITILGAAIGGVLLGLLTGALDRTLR